MVVTLREEEREGGREGGRGGRREGGRRRKKMCSKTKNGMRKHEVLISEGCLGDKKKGLSLGGRLFSSRTGCWSAGEKKKCAALFFFLLAVRSTEKLLANVWTWLVGLIDR